MVIGNGSQLDLPRIHPFAVLAALAAPSADESGPPKFSVFRWSPSGFSAIDPFACFSRR